ncbi:efflux RND transporter periplasmic adaptor subunit [Aquipseudomonas ullengensis]|uniref:Efflux RND transporter periplasmic adaptor subunit n=1 Tax=Aquipseudomonas ullengensis TaxID=2759166 RepID=A0A7W4LK42_9GAMM|nr:efflux RND transporter periplasmic adaptor subunit [Pseudomonas ullengensis]MBB2494497.1 efflux RND transporter periplasmic adaptor subunit [Pseudomonas ullengensis]
MPFSRSPVLLLASLLHVSQAYAVEVGADFSDPSAIRVLLAAKTETTLSSQMAGTLGEFNASLGQSVNKGALLAQFDCREGQARAKVANAELAMAKQNLEAKRHLRKLDAVGDLEVAMAATEVEKADGARSMSQTQTSYCKVNAPFAGRVAKVHAKPFQTVSAGTPLFDLVSDGALKVRLNVPSTLLPNLQTGMALQISIAETGKTYVAHISAINARVDAVAQAVELEATLDATHPELIAGMSGVARLADSQ